MGYSILSITDHNRASWAWKYFNRDPEALGMVEIPGNELSRDHHMLSYFTYLETDVRGERAQLEKVGEVGGLAVMAHPARYSKGVDWYVELFQEFDHLVGTEVYRNRGDVEIWDGVLTQLMPDRPVWGFTNDDTHSIDNIAWNWNVFVLEELSTENVRAAMESGQFYFCYSPNKQNGPVPEINRIEVDSDALTITIDAEGYESIVWISQGDEVHTGHTLCLIEATDAGAKGYVRARLTGEGGGITSTQPFGIKTGK